jgi:hypothetical protein
VQSKKQSFLAYLQGGLGQSGVKFLHFNFVL